MPAPRSLSVALRAALLAPVVLALSASSCSPPSGQQQSIPTTPPTCPFDAHLVMYGGDSLASHWPAWVTLPSGSAAFTTARGGSAFSGNYSGNPTMDTIGARILAKLNACGNHLGVVALSGGINDLSQNQAPSLAIDAIRALDAALYARGVAAVFVEIHPIAPYTGTSATIQGHRQAVNAWMSAPGSLHAVVVDCTSELEWTPGSDVLDPTFWTFSGAFTADPVHMNDAGYQAMAHCIEPVITAALS